MTLLGRLKRIASGDVAVMPAYRKAKKAYERAVAEGIDDYILDIHQLTTSNLPPERNILAEMFNARNAYRNKDEPAEDYVSRTARAGKVIECQDKLYIVKKPFWLGFSIRGREESARERNCLFFDEHDKELGKLEAIVTMRTHVLTLDYLGWNTAKDMTLDDKGTVIPYPFMLRYFPTPRHTPKKENFTTKK
ncbi:MAG: hypothetical protein V1725_08080 [archaeon]